MSKLRKHSINLNGHATSITIEDPFWVCLKDIAKQQGISMNALIAKIDEENEGNLSSALRVFVLETLKRKTVE
jgi:predicted DNA-binding ribbon-helix-helix protein